MSNVSSGEEMISQAVINWQPYAPQRPEASQNQMVLDVPERPQRSQGFLELYVPLDSGECSGTRPSA